MIYVKNIRNAKYNEHDEVWAIVRSLKSKSPQLKQVTALSPTTNLFFKYRNLVNSGKWNKQAFQDIYVPQFLEELKENKDISYPYLNKLYQLDKEGKNICLVCFCTDETMCHRSIIAGLLQGVGVNVVTETGNDYTKYYTMFEKI